MAKVADKSGIYLRIGTDLARSDSRSDSEPPHMLRIGTRVGQLADVIGTRPKAADMIGVSVATLQRYVSGKNMPPFDVAARLAIASGGNMAWLATGMGEMLLADERQKSAGATSHDLSEEHLTIALEFADRAVGTGWLPRPRYARLVRLLYDGVRQGLPTAQIEQFATAAARSMAAGGNGDGGESRVDAASAERDGRDPTGSAKGGKP